MVISKQKILDSFLWKLLERFSVQGVSFIVTICLARLLQPSEYGQIAIIIVFINLANVIIDGGFNTALIQKKEVDNKDFSTTLYLCLLTSLIFYAILYFMAPSIAAFYEDSSLCKILRIIGICLIAYAFNSIQRAYISRNMLFKKLFIASFISTIGAGAIGIFLAYRGWGVWALVYHYLASAFLMTFTMSVCTKCYLKPTLSFRCFKELFGYGWKILISNFMISLFVNIRSLIIGKYYTPTMLAYFDRGKQLPALMMDNINVSIQSVLFPIYSAEQNDINKLNNMVSRSIRTSSLVLFPILIGLFAVAKPLVTILLTEKWLPAVPFVQIFCIAYALMPLQLANIEVIKAIGRSDIFLRMETLKKVLEVTILIITVFINTYAIAIGVIIYNFICIFINTYPNKKLIGYTSKQLCRDTMPTFVLSCIMGIFVYSIQYLALSTGIILVLQFITGIVLYLALCVFFKVESLNYIKGILINKFKTSH